MDKQLTEPSVSLVLAKEFGLNGEEYEKILSLLGRIPTLTELGIFSVMWSEHCSYKNSIAVLKTLPRKGRRLLVDAGEENAGLVDIGDGLAICFKIESHNHPSAVEPYQGAATGVGGILRDIFTMGARPIAALNSLRFGELSDARSRYLFKRSVKGIGDYGNSFGVPTVAGEIYFDNCYKANCLINAMAVGLVEHNKTAKASAGAPGGIVLIVGSKTGKDGIHGATFASEEISEKSESKRPSVQVGDPFTEKLLLEATLEAINEGLITGIQDMGAAGITCSSTEMSAKAGVGMRIDLDAVPLRDNTMNSYEIMLSESQERMLVIVEKRHLKRIKEIFVKWDLECAEIGEVVEGNEVSVYHHSELKARVAAGALALGYGAPVYHRETREPEYIKEVRAFIPESIPIPSDLNQIFLRLLGSHNIASKRWAYQQYDSQVQTNSMNLVRNDAAIVRIKGTKKAISLKTDCNARYVYLNPRRGAQIAVAEAARNVVCSGAMPLAITNCLNFGNPYDPEVYWQFKEAAEGMSDACKVFETPVTGGNVSFYNQSPEAAVYPTPVIGMLGLIDDISCVMTPHFRTGGDLIFVLGNLRPDVGGSEYQKLALEINAGDAPDLDLEGEKKLHGLTLKLINERLINSAHDVSEGGVAVALAECCWAFEKNFGAMVTIDIGSARPDFVLFGEGQSEIIISASPSKKELISKFAMEHKVHIAMIGKVTEHARLIINKNLIDIDLGQARTIFENSIEDRMKE
jgi:phosphoribosylformylglycinamidine synthase